MKAKRYVIAVSGGIDSVVLLDAMIRGRAVGDTHIDAINAESLVVAHFDHGIRSDSHEDAEFVKRLAESYGVKYISKREELGPRASEELARQRRYAFLQTVCDNEYAILITAHHADDVVETIAINFIRGTGWRGLAVMDNAHIYRPLLGSHKEDIYTYAKKWDVSWREDSTNESENYLRNRVRQWAKHLDEDTKRQLHALRVQQIALKKNIDSEVQQILAPAPYSRYFFSNCGDDAALEVLRGLFMAEIGESPTLPVRQRILHEIKVARGGANVNVAKDVTLELSRTHFVVRQTR